MKRYLISYSERIIKGMRYSLTSHLSPLTSYLSPLTSLLLPLTSLLLVSCEKDIELDYHQVAPIHVVEGSVSNSGTVVRVSTTNNVDDNTTISDITQATVTVTTSDGKTYRIPHSSKGYYRLTSLKGAVDTEYQLDVELDGRHYTSTSTMQRTPELNQFRLVWKKVASERICFGDLRLQDIANHESWYYMHIYRNNIGYRWAVMNDQQNPNRELQQLFTLFREGSGDSDVLREGDKLHIEIRAIDQRAYDYLYSMQIMDNTGTNPIDNFSGGCLGYFTAFHQITCDLVYHIADVEEDDE